MRTANLLAALTLAATLALPGVVGAQEEYEKITLVSERMYKGIFRRTYEVVLPNGEVTYSSISIVFGADNTEGWTSLQAKQALIKQGRVDLLRLMAGAEVAPAVLQQWAAEGYDPIHEFADRPGDKPDIKKYLPLSETVPFSDIAGHWALDAILAMHEAGIVKGYPDGTFRPERPVTRAEFIALVQRIAGGEAAGQTAFVDVAGHWAEGAIAAAEARGWLDATEYAGRLLRPDQEMPRQEMARLVVRAAGLSVAEPVTTFTDNEKIPAEFRGYVAAATQAGLIGGYPDRTFRPDRGLTRAEAVVMLVRLRDSQGGRP